VYEATPLEPELPWWKQKRIIVFMVIICILITALLAGGLGVRFSRPNSNSSTGTTIISLSPSQSTTKTSFRCSADRNQLKNAVDQYVKNDCGRRVATLCKDLSDTYGWPMGSWCVIDVADMSSLFQGLDTFNEDISMWNVSKVTDMTSMFAEAGKFNRDISSWNISSVTNASYMFKGATSFSQNLCNWQDNFPYSNADDIFVDSGCTYNGTPSPETKGPFCAAACNTISPTDCFTTRDELKSAVDRYDQGYWDDTDSFKYGWPTGSWCVDNATDMSSLFEGLDTFNQNISYWNMSAVTDMSSMFNGASSFNQDLSKWNTSAVTTMNAMFWGASAFNGDVSSWDTSVVTDMSRMFMFWEASAFNFNGDISSWDTSAVTDMSWMFYGASSFNQDLSKWNTSAVTTMNAMFWGASAFNGDVSSWDTSAVTDMSSMFMFWEASAFNFDGDISPTSAVTDMSSMFYGASSFNQDLSKWNTSSVTTMNAMFYEVAAFNGDISSWDTSATTDMSSMFNGASSFNKNLCAWKDQFPYNNATDIFLDSGCTFQGNSQTFADLEDGSEAKEMVKQIKRSYALMLMYRSLMMGVTYLIIFDASSRA
jgi:surface protein